MGIPQICVKSYEADDILATLAEHSKKINIPYVGVTQDKDFFQCLVKGKVGAYHKKKTGWDFFSAMDAEAKWGVKISQTIEWQILCGDVCDNITGANGIGPVKATQILNTYGDLKTAYENISELTPAIQKSLKELEPRIDTVRKLVTLVNNVPGIDVVLDDYETKDFKIDKLGLRKILERNDLLQLENFVLEILC